MLPDGVRELEDAKEALFLDDMLALGRRNILFISEGAPTAVFTLSLVVCRSDWAAVAAGFLRTANVLLASACALFFRSTIDAYPFVHRWLQPYLDMPESGPSYSRAVR